MDDTQIADLKQFIVVTVSQQIAGVREDMSRLEQKLEQKFDGLDRKMDKIELHLHRRIDNLDLRLNQKIDSLALDVGNALHTINEETGRQIKDHERRIVRLEKRTA